MFQMCVCVCVWSDSPDVPDVCVYVCVWSDSPDVPDVCVCVCAPAGVAAVICVPVVCGGLRRRSCLSAPRSAGDQKQDVHGDQPEFLQDQRRPGAERGARDEGRAGHRRR